MLGKQPRSGKNTSQSSRNISKEPKSPSLKRTNSLKPRKQSKDSIRKLENKENLLFNLQLNPYSLAGSNSSKGPLATKST